MKQYVVRQLNTGSYRNIVSGHRDTFPMSRKMARAFKLERAEQLREDDEDTFPERVLKVVPVHS